MWIDVVMIALPITGFIKGAMQGIVMALFTLAGWIIGLAAALKLSAVAAVYLQEHTNINIRWIPLIAFVLVFFVTVLLVRWAGKAIENLFNLAKLGWINRLGGALLYSGMYLLVCCMLLFYAEKMRLINPDTLASSRMHGATQGVAPGFIYGMGTILPPLKDAFRELEDFFGKVPDKW